MSQPELFPTRLVYPEIEGEADKTRGLLPTELIRFLLKTGGIKVVDRPLSGESTIEPDRLDLQLLEGSNDWPKIIVVGLVGQQYGLVMGDGHRLWLKEISLEDGHPIHDITDISIHPRGDETVRWDEVVISQHAAYHDSHVDWTPLVRHDPEQTTEPNTVYLFQGGELIDRPPNWRATDTLVLCPFGVGLLRDDENNFIPFMLIPGLPVGVIYETGIDEKRGGLHTYYSDPFGVPKDLSDI